MTVGENNKKLLNLLRQNLEEYLFPTFISEGTSNLKLKSIRSNQYLNFCYEKFCNMRGSLTIFGHSLDECSDGHIIDAINESQIDTINYGIYSNLNKEGISNKIAEINSKFRNKRINYFCSETIFDYANGQRKHGFGKRLWNR